jgi:hypothetical protein
MTETIHPFPIPPAFVGRVLRHSAELATDRVYVLFTSPDETLAAARVGGGLARALGGRLTVLHFRPVDFAAPLEAPSGLSPAETEEFRTRLETEVTGAEVRVCVCRDARTALPNILTRRSLVLVGGQRHWWRTSADRWRRALEGAGHLVVMVDRERA